MLDSGYWANFARREHSVDCEKVCPCNHHMCKCKHPQGLFASIYRITHQDKYTQPTPEREFLFWKDPASPEKIPLDSRSEPVCCVH